MKDKLVAFLADRYGWTPKEIAEAPSFEALGLDSLSLYSLVTDCEETFAITIDTDDFSEIDSPAKFIGYVLRKL